MRAPGEIGVRSGAPPQPSGPSRALAAFDFDGTLTVRDSFAAFLRWRTTRTGWGIGLLRLLPEIVSYPFRRDRGRLKAASVRMFLKGLGREELAAEADAFAGTAWDRLMRPDALIAWAAHRQAGDLLVIVTASPEEVVAPFARRLGADALIGTRLAWTPDGRVAAGLDGANCRGPVKVKRLRQRFGEAVSPTYAYGDTSGDREMLALASHGRMKAFRGRP
jgi:phosphatidylglycerophosphatase C